VLVQEALDEARLNSSGAQKMKMARNADVRNRAFCLLLLSSLSSALQVTYARIALFDAVNCCVQLAAVTRDLTNECVALFLSSLSNKHYYGRISHCPLAAVAECYH
jgi:hypothetical protein